LAQGSITAATAGALALAGAVTGVLWAIWRRSGSSATTSSTVFPGSVPVTNLLLILVGMPLLAVVAGWLLAGREPAVIGRQPME
jgi:putative ABC transport system permease protein